MNSVTLCSGILTSKSQNRFQALATEIMASTPEEPGEFLVKELAKWSARRRKLLFRSALLKKGSEVLE